MSSSLLVLPSPPTGNNRRVELAGFDLWAVSHIDTVFVYPSDINIDRFKAALGRTLSLWSIVAGHVRAEDNDHYFIEMSDNPIPITVVVNNDLDKWSLDSNVIVEVNQNILPPFIDEIRVIDLSDNSQDEPLVRIKLTHIIQSGEWVLGVSWSHILGDAAANLHFLNTLSCFYQSIEPLGPLPIFERRLWREDEADPLFLLLMKQQRDSKPTSEIIRIFLADQVIYDPVNLHFSGEQLTRLRTLAGGNNITIQDALSAYIIVTLNTYCYNDNDERLILRTNTAVNYRGVSDSIGSQGQVSNALLMMLSDNFDNPYSLSNIAKIIRRSINKSREPKFLETWIATADGLMRNNAKNNKTIDMGIFPNEMVVNSNYRYDWASFVDFGYTDKCRFYTAWTGALYLRVFRLNPEKHGNEWLPRDRNGAELSFRMERELKENFLNAWKRDVDENFENVNK